MKTYLYYASPAGNSFGAMRQERASVMFSFWKNLKFESTFGRTNQKIFIRRTKALKNCFGCSWIELVASRAITGCKKI